MRHLEDEGAAAGGAEPAGRGLGRGRVVAKGLHQPAHSEAVQGRSEQHRDDQILLRLAGDVGEDGRPVGRLVHQQLLEQGVVMVGELLEHVEAVLRLAVGEVGGDVDLLGRLARPVFEGALEREVDEAGDLLAPFLGADRDLAGDQGRRAHRLKRFEQVANAAAGLVDLVDEDEVGDSERLELPQSRLGEDGAVGVGIDDDDGEVRGRHRERSVGREADRAGRVEEGEAVAEKLEMHQVQFGRAGALPGFRARIAGAGAGVDAALAVDRPGGEEQGLGEARLSRSARSNEGDRPGAYRSVGHASLLAFPRRDPR